MGSEDSERILSCKKIEWGNIRRVIGLELNQFVDYEVLADSDPHTSPLVQLFFLNPMALHFFYIQ